MKYNAVANGKYAIRIEAGATQAGDEQAKMGLQIDGQQVKDFEVSGFRNPKWYEHTVELTQGEHSIAAAFLNDFYDPNAPERRRDRNLGVSIIEVTGPEGAEGLDLQHDIHKKFVTVKPSDTVTVRQAASQVLRPVLYRGFRRPVTDAEVDRFAGLVEKTVNEEMETYGSGLMGSSEVAPMRREAVPAPSVPPGLLDAAALRVRRFSDDEAAVQRIPGWNIQCLQLTSGMLAGQAVDLHLPSIQVLFEEYRNVSTSHSGSAPSGAVIFGVATGMKGHGILNGLPWGNGISAFDARHELDSVVPPGELISLVVDRHALDDYVWHTEHVDIEHWLSPGPVVLDDASLAQLLAAHLLAMMTACQGEQ